MIRNFFTLLIFSFSLGRALEARPLQGAYGEEEEENSYRLSAEERMARELRSNREVLAIKSDGAWKTFEVGGVDRETLQKSDTTTLLEILVMNGKQPYVKLATERLFKSEEEITGLLERLKSGRYRLNLILKAGTPENKDTLGSADIERMEVQDLLFNQIIFRRSSSELGE
jgi:hypothetical protein